MVLVLWRCFIITHDGSREASAKHSVPAGEAPVGERDEEERPERAIVAFESPDEEWTESRYDGAKEQREIN